jgi:hypothetical protein
MRTGKFTSSEIAALMTSDKSGENFGKPALTYIDEKYFETKLGRPLGTEVNARPVTWGNCCEAYVYEKLLPIEYRVQNDVRYQHPRLPWSGAPDAIAAGTVADIKSPHTLKSFMQLQEIELGQFGEGLKKGKPDYYWQLISNAVLIEQQNGEEITHAELILFCPYKSELDDLREFASDYYEWFWIANAMDGELPYLPDGGNYASLTYRRFELSEGDKLALINMVKLATELLNGMLTR